jgi:hypothetical protein
MYSRPENDSSRRCDRCGKLPEEVGYSKEFKTSPLIVKHFDPSEENPPVRVASSYNVTMCPVDKHQLENPHRAHKSEEQRYSQDKWGDTDFWSYQ